MESIQEERQQLLRVVLCIPNKRRGIATHLRLGEEREGCGDSLHTCTNTQTELESLRQLRYVLQTLKCLGATQLNFPFHISSSSEP